MALHDRITSLAQAVGADIKAQFSALALKANLASPAFTGNPTAPTAAQGTNTGQIASTAFVNAEIASLTKADLGLSSVNDTSDADKPVSTATQVALDAKVGGNSEHNIGYLNIPLVSASANTLITKAHAGGGLKHPGTDATARTFTFDSNANQNWVDGTVVTIWNQNGGGVVTIVVTTNTLRRSPDGATGNRTLAANGMITAIWDAASLTWGISGGGDVVSAIQQMMLAVMSPDVTPNAFSFNSNSGVNPSTQVTSNTISLTGFDIPLPWTCSGGTASIAGGAFAASGTISPGQSVRVQVTSSSSFSTAKSATFTAGGVSGTFTATTRAADVTPNAFSFTSASGVNPSTNIASNAVTLTGYEAAIPWSVSGGTASISGAAYATSGTLSVGQTVTVLVASSGSFSTAKSATFTAGGVSGTFTATTRAIDTTPNAFTFANKTGQTRNAVVYSLPVTISGFDGSLSWSGTTTAADAGASVNSGPYTPSGTITAGQTMMLFVKSSPTAGGSVTVTININGVTSTWTVTSN